MTSVNITWFAAFAAVAGSILSLSTGYGATSAPTASAPRTRPAERDPLVGAIRWDGWGLDNRDQTVLNPKQWHYRLPFFAKVLSDNEVQINGDSAEVMDQEIEYASAAGIDYWAFDYTRENGGIGYYALQRYLASKNKSKINFCLLLLSGNKDPWNRHIDVLVKYLKDPSYQKVDGGRPLVYFFQAPELGTMLGSPAQAVEAIQALRAQCVAAGLKTPYLVAMKFETAKAAQAVQDFQMDAISAYTAQGWFNKHQGYPHQELVRQNKLFWDRCLKTGKQVIPIVNAGWDGRPRLVLEDKAKNYRDAWFEPATPKELAAHVRAAIDWTHAHPDATRARTILIYAWNENSEGGWLTPTLDEGDARLQAIKQTLDR